MSNSISRLDPFRGLSSLQDQVNRLFDDNVHRGRSGNSEMAVWSPAVDIFETENEIVVKADLPDVQEKDLDVRVENNTVTIRGERKFDREVNEDNYLRVERTYGTFTRSFSLPNTVNYDAIRAEYRNGVLTVRMPKREETKPRQIKIGINSEGKPASDGK
jgi:HSP20 family protein